MPKRSFEAKESINRAERHSQSSRLMASLGMLQSFKQSGCNSGSVDKHPVFVLVSKVSCLKCLPFFKKFMLMRLTNPCSRPLPSVKTSPGPSSTTESPDNSFRSQLSSNDKSRKVKFLLYFNIFC